MFSYVTIGTNNHAKAVPFYDAIMSALGYKRLDSYPDMGWYSWGPGGDNPNKVWLCKPFNEQPATVGNGSMTSFVSTSNAMVDAFHAAALAHGGTCEGKPGFREAYGPGLYVAYVRDVDGNKLSTVCSTAV
jgi:catechol 2,3-dioxygenase-like lactoylglutathione lyase family enzyme